MAEVRLLVGDVREQLRRLSAGSISMAVTSPPYWGLRDYGLPPSVWGGDPLCEHAWETESYYQEGGATTSSKEAFTEAGPENAARLKATRWRESTTCCRCGAWKGCLGLEPTPRAYVRNMVEVFREVWRVLHPSGTLWLNLGDSYSRDARKGQHKPGDSGKQAYVYDCGGGRASSGSDLRGSGLKAKDLVGIPWRVAFALQEEGWYLRSDVIWAKGNALPESVTDRPSRNHEYLFLLAKNERYYYDHFAVREKAASKGRGSGNVKRKVADGTRSRAESHLGSSVPWEDTDGYRNRRTVWAVNIKPFAGAHFAVFPPALIDPCVLAGTSEGGVCAKCGAPRRRLVEKGEPLRAWQEQCGADSTGGYHGTATKDFAAAKAQNASAVKARILAGMCAKRTVGWEATCRCEAEAVPATVLDPFGGSGTTAQVAMRHGRDAVLIELNLEYANIALKRLAPLSEQEVMG